MIPTTSSEPMTLSIAAHRDMLNGQWMISRIDLETKVTRHQTRFKIPVPLEQALEPTVVDALLPLMPIQPKAQVYIDSSSQIILPQISLIGVRIVAQRVVNGVQAAAIRFNQFCGSLQALIAPRYRIDHQPNNALGTAPSPQQIT